MKRGGRISQMAADLNDIAICDRMSVMRITQERILWLSDDLSNCEMCNEQQ